MQKVQTLQVQKFVSKFKAFKCKNHTQRARRNKPTKQRIFREAKLFYRYYNGHVIIHLSKLIEYIISKVIPNVNYGLRVIMMCQCRFEDCMKCTTPVSDVDNGRGCACVGAEGIWELYFSLKNYSKN